MPNRVLRKALSGVAGRHWIVALAAAKCFAVGLMMVGLPVKLDRLGWSDWELGLFASVSAATYTVTCAFYSLAVHRMPLRRMMGISSLVATAVTLGIAATDARWLLFLLGAISACGAAFFWPSLMAWIGESDDEHLVGDMSAFNCAWTVSLTLGFVLGGVMETRAKGSSLLATAVVSLVLALVIPFAHIRGRLALMGTPMSPPTAVILPRRFLAAGWVAAFLVSLSVSVPGAIFVKLNTELGYSPNDYGTLFGLRGGVQAFVVLGLGVFQGWRYRRWPLVGSLLLAALGAALLALAPGKGLLAVAFVLLGAGSGLGYSMGFYYSVHGRRNRKRNAGLFEAIIASQSIVGGAMGGSLASAFGRRAPYAVLAVLASLGAAAQGIILRRVAERLRAMRSSGTISELPRGAAGVEPPPRPAGASDRHAS